MSTPSAPLYEALISLSQKKGHRLHLPGHKGLPLGSAFDSVFSIDYTEIPATGNLYDDDGIIQQAEAEAARYYGMDGCFFLTCGATQGVKAALLAYCGADAPVVVDRNCHQSAFDACAMLGLHPTYVSPAINASTGLGTDIDPHQLAKAIEASGAKAALVTSPTYYGFCLDIAALAKAAHSAGAALIVDSAHGSHLRACGTPDPACQGADAVIFSAHKTLFALGQGAYLLFRLRDDDFGPRLRRATALFGTTSPSYPIMASLDYTRAWLEANPSAYPSTAEMCRNAAVQIARDTPFGVVSPAPGFDPCRLVISAAAAGISGFDCANHLRAMGFEPEMADDRHVVLIVTPADRCLAGLVCALGAIPAQPAGRLLQATAPPLPQKAMSPRQAYFSKTTTLPLGACAGKIAAENLSPYPPGVPVVSYGEVIDQLSIEYLLKKGYNELSPIVIIDK